MTHNFECEYINSEGEYDYFDIELESDCKWEDDSFDYAGTHCTGGVGGTFQGASYPIMENYPTWNNDIYTFSENWLIAIWLMANYDWIEKTILKEYEEHCIAMSEY
jgi:hypothetical protein